MSIKRIITMTAPLGLLLLAAAVQAAGPPFELAVKQHRLFRDRSGTLVFAEGAVYYRPARTDESEERGWSYLDLRQVRVVSTEIVLATYEDRGRLALGADRTHEFELTEGAVGADLVEFLLARIDRPVVTAVLPHLPAEPRFRLPVKYERFGRGSDGALLLYDQGLAYVTEREREARYWRFRDLYSVLPLDRYRLEIRAYEGDGGETRPFTFQLKTELPAAMYDALWRAVNPARLTASDRESDLVAQTAGETFRSKPQESPLTPSSLVLARSAGRVRR